MVHQRTERDLGGLAWDRRIVDFLKEQYQKETGLDARLTHDEVLFREWLEKAEMARMQLAERERVVLSIRDRHGVNVELSRHEVQQRIAPLLEQTLSAIRGMCLEAEAKGDNPAFQRILLAGGATRMPIVGQRLAEVFGVPVESKDPESATVRGAALFGTRRFSKGPAWESSDPDALYIRFTCPGCPYWDSEFVGDLGVADEMRNCPVCHRTLCAS